MCQKPAKKREWSPSTGQFIFPAWHDDENLAQVRNFISGTSDYEPHLRNPWWRTRSMAGMLPLWSSTRMYTSYQIHQGDKIRLETASANSAETNLASH